MKVLSLSEYVIRRATEKEVPITNLKLQKTLYYIQGYTLRCFSEPAFDEEIRNWQYGPVAPAAYFMYSSYGANPLEVNEAITIEAVSAKLKKLFDKVIDKCLLFTARELVQKTHEEAPWAETSLNEEITRNKMMKYFCSKNPLDLDIEED